MDDDFQGSSMKDLSVAKDRCRSGVVTKTQVLLGIVKWPKRAHIWLALVGLVVFSVLLIQAKQELNRRQLSPEAKAKADALKSKLLSGRFYAGEPLTIGVTVRWIPPGRFTMGSPPKDNQLGNAVQHEVAISRGFFLAETECTQAQWQSVMRGNPSQFLGAELPVERVSWNDAVKYCRKLTTKQQAEGILPETWEWRLPTEAEWEYAARAGTTGALYGELDAIAWYDDNSGNRTHVVKGKKANAWGLYDMIGNVEEWCSDWYDSYPTATTTDPSGPSSGVARVLRGHSWIPMLAHSVADRDMRRPNFRSNDLGFRPVLSLVR